MGCVENITFDKFPKQSKHLNRNVKVCFHYDITKEIIGRIIRDDVEEPGRTIIKLNDDRIVLAVECQYSLI
ncbi:MAG: hypothetical protein ACFFD2_17180 [Promethearchaeota archaeon]